MRKNNPGVTSTGVKSASGVISRPKEEGGTITIIIHKERKYANSILG